MSYHFIDLFAGAGGLSEGFIQAGFEPIAHVEIENSACNTLRTRAAYHYLKANNKYKIYISYLKGEITRKQLYLNVPQDIHYYIHPDVKQNRFLLVREAARLQSFPDDYYFEGKKVGANRTAA
jgi:site-specific DNA-cytosine methylase